MVSRSNKSLIIVLVLILLAAIGGGVWWLQQSNLPPEALQGPTIVDVLPASEEIISRSSEFVFVFDQKMDHASVEQALKIEPDFSYAASWHEETDVKGERLVITPQEPLAWQTTYRATIGIEGLNLAGLALSTPAEVSFTTSSQVRVADVLPSEDSQMVELNPSITVRFEQPIVDSDLLANQAELPQPLELDPPTLGIGQWLEDDFYGFYPTDPLNAGTEYIVSVKSVIAPGMELSEVYEWLFVTEGGQVDASFPVDGAEEVERTTDIRVKFAEEMERDSVEENFQLTVEGEEVPVAGEFIWEDDRTLTFVPSARLEVSSNYEVEVSAEARSKGGTGGLNSPYRASFTTVDFLVVESVQPAPETTEVTLADSVIAVQFNHPVVQLVGLVEKEGLPIPISIAPPLAGEGEWVTTSLFVYRPTEPPAPSTAYVVTVSDELQDTLGSSLDEPYSWTFITEYPRVLRVEPTGRLGPVLNDPSAAPTDDPPLDTRPLTVAPNGPLGLRFNQAMEPSSTEAAFSLEGPNGLVTGRFEWQEDGILLQFFPNTPLAPVAPYRIVLATGAKAAIGGETGEPFSLLVVAAPPPEVINSQPLAGAQDVAPQSDRVTLFFNTELNTKEIEQYIDIQPPVGTLNTSFYTPSLQLDIFFDETFASETSYTITIDGQLSDKSGQTMGEDYVLSFTTGRLPPFLGLPVNLGTFNPVVDAEVLVTHRNISQLEFELYRLTEDEMWPVFESPEWSEYTGNPAELVGSWSVTPDSKPDEAALASTTLPLEEKKGLYFLHVTSPNEIQQWSGRPYSSKMIVLFTPVNLTVKQTPDEIVVWATDMASGEPLADVDIRILSDREDRVTITSGLTDDLGIFRYNLPLSDTSNRSFFAASYESDETISGIAMPHWAGNAGPREFAYDTAPPRLYANLYTERPIYRPGQTIYYKGVVREREGRALVFPTLQSMRVRLQLPSGPEQQIIEPHEVVFSPFGTFYGSFQLPEEAPTGIYHLIVEEEEIGVCQPISCPPDAVEDGTCQPVHCFWKIFSTLIQVAEYERPEFEVKVAVDSAAVVQGEEVTAKVSATYYAGGAFTDAGVTWRQRSQTYPFAVASLTGYWNWWDEELVNGPLPSLSQGGTSKLSPTGEALIELQTLPESEEGTLLSQEEPVERLPLSQRVIIEADVQDKSGEVITGEAEMIVHRGEFYIGLNSETSVGQLNQPFVINVATANTAAVLEGGHDLTLEFSKRQWGSEPDPFGGWSRTFTDTLITTESATTDDEGRAMVEFTPAEGGSYTVLAIGQDSLGNEIRSRSTFWVIDASSSVLWGVTLDDRLDLSADKQEYKVGDVARILVATPQEDMTALISEEQYTIGDLSIRTLESNAEVIEIPITEEMIPNTYINVVAVSGTSPERPAPKFGMGYVKLSVSGEPKLLHIAVTPQRSQEEGPPEPGEEVKFNIRITDAAEQPVEAEVSLAMVDKAVLALAKIEQTSLFDAFYHERFLAVQTGSSVTVNIDRINERLLPVEAAQAGGGGGGDGFGPSDVRSEILDTAYWKADLVTDENGEVEVTIQLPDNLTTWTMIAKAVTKDGPLVGEQEEELIATLPLIVRPNLPRFLVVGDELELPVLVQNNTDAGLDTLVSLETTGLTIEMVDEDAQKRISIGPNGREVLYFPISVADVPTGTTTITIRAQAGDFSDALQQELPIIYPTSPEVSASSGVIRAGEGAAVESIQLPEGTNPKQGGLTIELAPSLAGATEKSLDALQHYPYAHTEAVTSRLLANAATLRALRLMQSERSELEEAVESQLSEAIALLAASQNQDGGWGWWPGNQSEPWLTAYVLFGLNESQKAGIEVPLEPAPVVDYLLDWLAETENAQDKNTLQTRTFVFYVLSDLQSDDLADTILTGAESLFEKRSLLPAGNAARAYLLLTFDNLGDQLEKVRTLAAELTARAHIAATGAQWQENNLQGATFESSLGSTAQALRALVRVEPEHLLIQQTVRWLMNARRPAGLTAASWGSTLDSAWAVLALTDYMQSSGELEANFRYEVALNGEVIVREQASEDNLTEPVRQEVSLAELLLDETNELIITPAPPAAGESNSGRLYYSAWLRTFLPSSDLQSRNEGIAVSRHYEVVDPVTLLSTGGIVESARVGNVVQVRLRIEAPHDLHYFTLESPIPAGAEIVDASLATSSSEAIANQKGMERTHNRFFYEGWSQEIIRDEKVVLFSDLLPRGTYEYIYWIRATIPGEFNALPTLGYQTYHAEVFGRSEGGQFSVIPVP